MSHIKYRNLYAGLAKCDAGGKHGERERANLVVRLARICLYRPSGAHFTYAHAPNLRETPTRHVYPLPFAIRANQMQRSRREPRAGDASILALSTIYT